MTPRSRPPCRRQCTIRNTNPGTPNNRALAHKHSPTALADSPAGQMAWIIEKYAQWTDCVQNNVRHPENAVERDVLLDIATHYWMTNSAGSSAKLYWESFTQPDYRPIEQPMGISLFPKELFLCTERLASTRYQQLVMFNDQHAAGGHFASLEQPDALVTDIRRWHAQLLSGEWL